MLEKRYYVLTLAGEVGPCSQEDLRDHLRVGIIAPGDRVRTALGTQEGTVATLLGLDRQTRSSGLTTVTPTGSPRTPSAGVPAGSATSGAVKTRGSDRLTPPGEVPSTRPPSDRTPATGTPSSGSDRSRRASDRQRRSGSSGTRRPGAPAWLLPLVVVSVLAGVIAWFLLSNRPDPSSADPGSSNGNGLAAPQPAASTAPVVSLEASDSAVRFNPPRQVRLTVRLDRDPPTALTVPLVVSGGPQNGREILVPESVTFNVGTRSREVLVVGGPSYAALSTTTVTISVRGGTTIATGPASSLKLDLLPMLRPQDRPGATIPGVHWLWFPGDWGRLPDLSTTLHAARGTADFLASLALPGERGAVATSGFLEIPRDGAYRFSLAGPTHARFWIGGRLVVEADDVPADQPRWSQPLGLEAGSQVFRLEWIEDRREHAPELGWAGDAVTTGVIPATSFVRTP